MVFMKSTQRANRRSRSKTEYYVSNNEDVPSEVIERISAAHAKALLAGNKSFPNVLDSDRAVLKDESQ